MPRRGLTPRERSLHPPQLPGRRRRRRRRRAHRQLAHRARPGRHGDRPRRRLRPERRLRPAVDERHHAVDEALPARAPGADPVRGRRRPRLPLRARAPQRHAERRRTTTRSTSGSRAPACAPARPTTTASSPATARRRSGASARCGRPTPTSRPGSASSPARSTTAASTPRTPRWPRSRTSTSSSASATTSTRRTTTRTARRGRTRRARTATATSRRSPSTATSTGSTTPTRTSCAVRETHSLLSTWDDHEVEDNYAGDHEGDQSPVNRVPFLERRANGYQAFFEHMPMLRDGDRVYGNAPARPPRRAVRARPAPLPLRPALRRPRGPALPGGRGARPHDARRRAEGVVHARARGLAARPGSSSPTR